MKKGISVILTVILMMSLIACGGDVNQRVNRRYRNLQSYTALRIQIFLPLITQTVPCILSGASISIRY